MAKGSGGGGRGAGNSSGRISAGDIVQPAGRAEFRSIVIERTRGYDARVGRTVPGFLVRGERARPGQLAYGPFFIPRADAVKVG